MLLKEALRNYYENPEVLWQKRSKLFGLTQTGSLEAYIDEVNKLTRQLEIPNDIKLNLFINGLNDRLKGALKMRQPANYEDAINYARLKDSVTQKKSVDTTELLTAIKSSLEVPTTESTQDKNVASKVDTLVEKFEKLQQKLTKEEDKGKIAALHGIPSDMHREITRLKDEIHTLKKGQSFNKHRNFPPNGRNLRSQTGEIICNFCHRVGHYKRSCPEFHQQRPQRYVPQGVNNYWRGPNNSNRNYYNNYGPRRDEYEPQGYWKNDNRQRYEQRSQDYEQSQPQYYALPPPPPQPQYQEVPPPPQNGTRSYGIKSKVKNIILKDDNWLKVNGTICQYPVEILFDSGAATTLIQSKLYCKLFEELGQIQPCKDSLYSANGSDIEVIGKVYVPFVVNGQKFPFVAIIAKGMEEDVIFGRDILKEYQVNIDFSRCEISIGHNNKNLISKVLTPEQKHGTQVQNHAQVQSRSQAKNYVTAQMQNHVEGAPSRNDTRYAGKGKEKSKDLKRYIEEDDIEEDETEEIEWCLLPADADEIPWYQSDPFSQKDFDEECEESNESISEEEINKLKCNRNVMNDAVIEQRKGYPYSMEANKEKLHPKQKELVGAETNYIQYKEDDYKKMSHMKYIDDVYPQHKDDVYKQTEEMKNKDDGYKETKHVKYKDDVYEENKHMKYKDDDYEEKKYMKYKGDDYRQTKQTKNKKDDYKVTKHMKYKGDDYRQTKQMKNKDDGYKVTKYLKYKDDDYEEKKHMKYKGDDYRQTKQRNNKDDGHKETKHMKYKDDDYEEKKHMKYKDDDYEENKHVKHKGDDYRQTKQIKNKNDDYEETTYVKYKDDDYEEVQYKKHKYDVYKQTKQMKNKDDGDKETKYMKYKDDDYERVQYMKPGDDVYKQTKRTRNKDEVGRHIKYKEDSYIERQYMKQKDADCKETRHVRFKDDGHVKIPQMKQEVANYKQVCHMKHDSEDYKEIPHLRNKDDDNRDTSPKVRYKGLRDNCEALNIPDLINDSSDEIFQENLLNNSYAKEVPGCSTIGKSSALDIDGVLIPEELDIDGEVMEPGMPQESMLPGKEKVQIVVAGQRYYQSIFRCNCEYTKYIYT